MTLSNTYNNRLQASTLTATGPTGTLFNHAYCYANCAGGGQTKNNGNLVLDTDTGPSADTATYAYDTLNRVKTAVGPGWGDSYTYDPFGNLYQLTPYGTGVGQTLVAQPDSGNHLLGVGLVYDLAGNVITDNLGTSYTYDAEGRLASAGGWAYTYDGDGNRVMKTAGGLTGSVFWYGADGRLTDESSVSTPVGPIQRDLYLNGQLIAKTGFSASPSYFVLPDQLGTSRVTVNFSWNPATGTNAPTYTNYYPFGAFITQPTDKLSQRFTGKERDSESGNDYFGARYYASSMGRWLSPDPINLTEERLVNPANTLNKYAYAANNPLKYVDPDGQDITYFYDQGGIAGHAMLFVYNQQTGASAIEDFGPKVHSPIWTGHSDHETREFTSADDIRHNTAALTIQTTPELAQQVIDYIHSHPDPALWVCTGPQCSSQVWKILSKFKLDSQSFYDKYMTNPGQTPRILWGNLNSRYNPGQGNDPPKNGRDYGRPRFDMFQLFWQSLPQSKPREVVTHRICDADGKNCH